jgi:hypothetical protein
VSAPDDQVTRRMRFQAAHPEWHITSPASPGAVLRGETDWVARRGETVIRGRELRDLLDQAEKLSGEGGDAS